MRHVIRYAVEDIVLGDILRQGVDFFWIDWQQGGSQGGLSGDKQNPTMWLNHLRCTDRCHCLQITKPQVGSVTPPPLPSPPQASCGRRHARARARALGRLGRPQVQTFTRALKNIFV